MRAENTISTLYINAYTFYIFEQYLFTQYTVGKRFFFPRITLLKSLIPFAREPGGK